jgi:hypothetical protein
MPAPGDTATMPDMGKVFDEVFGNKAKAIPGGPKGGGDDDEK